MLLHLTLAFMIYGKIQKSHTTINLFKISWNEEFELPDDHILHRIFKIILNIF